MFIRSAFNYDTMDASNEASLLCSDESLTVQSARDESDINTIVKRFGLTGELPSDLAMPLSIDVTGAPDFQTAMNVMRDAHEEFLRVPAEIRARFNNEPARLVNFLEDKDNFDEAVKLGFINKPITITPAPAPAPAPASP